LVEPWFITIAESGEFTVLIDNFLCWLELLTVKFKIELGDEGDYGIFC
jgi:hypothetical protein